MKKRVILGLALLTIGAGASAMNLKGKIKDAKTGEEIIGASVVVKEEPSKGAVTGLDGSFSLSVNRPTFTIVCTYIGYKNYEMKVTSKDADIEIPLTSDDVLLGEVTVVATNPGRSEAGARAIFAGYHGGERHPAYVGCDH